MLELLSPAGSMEALVAAVQNGANAVYLGLGDFNARKNAKNFTEADLAEAVRYCHIRGVKVYVTLNTLVTDREMENAAATVRQVNDAGVDAVIVQDVGLVSLIRRTAPDLHIHGSTQMSIHSLDGAKVCAAMGMTRVVLSRELSREQLRYICANSPIEIEVFVHGALCMCYSGQCYMSSVIGRRSGNRGLCAQPCRLEYGFGSKADGHPLSLKDNCLANYITELEDMGVACLKIEGRMKRPEYVAITADVYSRAIKARQAPSTAELARMRAAFSRQGFTDGYYTGDIGPQMFGIREEGSEKETKTLFTAARATYERGQRQLVPVRFFALAQEGQPFQLAASDDDGHLETVTGPVPEPAKTRSLDEESITGQLQKTGGTPYTCQEVRCSIDEGLSLPLSAINSLRREALEKLTQARAAVAERPTAPYEEGYKLINSHKSPVFTVSVTHIDQITDELLQLRPKLVYIPLAEAAKSPDVVWKVMGTGTTEVAVILPRIIPDNEQSKIEKQLEYCHGLGIDQALIGNLGQIPMTMKLGYKLRSDFGLNVFNSQSLDALAKLGLLSATLSFELSLSQIRDLSKPLDTEIIGYGRLPLMVTENCVFKNRDGACACGDKPQLIDRKGAKFPLSKDGDSCRTVILNSEVLYLGDKHDEYSKLGLWAVRLAFTDEAPEEVADVLKQYQTHDKPLTGSFTRGLYFRGTM